MEYTRNTKIKNYAFSGVSYAKDERINEFLQNPMIDVIDIKVTPFNDVLVYTIIYQDEWIKKRNGGGIKYEQKHATSTAESAGRS